MSADPLVPIDAAPGPLPAPQRPRYALHVPGQGFVGRLLGKHHFLFVDGLDAAHHWDRPEDLEGWLRGLPAGHAKRLADRQLFVVRSRFVAERIVGAWELRVPIAGPEAQGAKS